MRFIVIPGAELAGAMHHGLLRNGGRACTPELFI